MWNNALVTFILEAVLLMVGVWLYVSGTKARTAIGKYGMLVFAIVLIAVNGINIFEPPPESLTFVVIFSLGSYLVFGGVAFWLDRERI